MRRCRELPERGILGASTCLGPGHDTRRCDLSNLCRHDGVLTAPISMERADWLLGHERGGHRRTVPDAKVVWT